MPEPDTATAGEQKKPGGVFREWILPIVIGLALGVGIVKAWQHTDQVLQMFDSAAWKIVARWEYGSFEENDKLSGEVQALGKEARADVLDAFRRIEVPAHPYGEDEWKTWAATLLVGEPFFDSRSLLEICKDTKAPVWDRSAAAAALVQLLRKDVNPVAVVEPLLLWLENLDVSDHNIPLRAVQQMRSDGIFPPDQDDRLRKALLRLSARDSRPKPEDEDEQVYISSDRTRALRFAGTFVTQDDVKKLLWTIALDDTDDVQVRSVAIQTLAGNKQFDDIEPWKKLAASADGIVRQTVADNLSNSQDAAYDAVIAPFHTDAAAMVRKSSVETQVQRKRPTMLPVMDLLLEDAEPWVRRESLIACGTFKDHLDGMGARQGQILRLLETSDAEEDVEGAILALHAMTGQTFGFEAGDIDAGNSAVRSTALAAFISDAEGRKLTADKWRKYLGGNAVWTDSDRRKTLEKLAKHADPDNVKRAEAELLKLTAPK